MGIIVGIDKHDEHNELVISDTGSVPRRHEDFAFSL